MGSRPECPEFCHEITEALSGDTEWDISPTECIFRKSGLTFPAAWISVDPRDEVSSNVVFLKPHIKEELCLELTLRFTEKKYMRQPDCPAWSPSSQVVVWTLLGRNQLRAWINQGSLLPFSLPYKSTSTSLVKMSFKLILDKLGYGLKALILSPSWRLLLFWQTALGSWNWHTTQC